MSAKRVEILLKPGRCLMCLALEMTADFNCRQDFLQCMDLIKVV